MNHKIRQKLASEKRQISKRLERAVRGNNNGPVLSASNIRYELSDKIRAISHGGIGGIHRMVKKLGLSKQIDDAVKLFKVHHPYYESDHVLNIAYNVLCGGQTLDDIEHRRQDRTFLDALGTKSIPDPTTAGDFCRRFQSEDVEHLMEAINETRVKVWQRQPKGFLRETARIDADGSLVSTSGECKEGMDISYNGIWGYHPLLVSLANTQEPLFIVNRPGNSISAEGAIPLYDKAIALCRRAGFSDILLRGDTDFSRTSEAFDRWTDDGVRFVLGYKGWKGLISKADSQPDKLYEELVRRAERQIKTVPRAKPKNVKEEIVRQREYRNIRPVIDEVVEFEYQPQACKKNYRIVAVRRNLSIERGENVLFDEIRYFFYLTNDCFLTPHEIVHEAHARCNQENLIEQLKNGVHALHAPVNTLNANWAYMVMASLAWSIKAWVSLTLPIIPRWKARHKAQQSDLLRMEFRTFLNAFVNIPAQIVKTGRTIIYRLLAWTPLQHLFFRFLDAT